MFVYKRPRSSNSVQTLKIGAGSVFISFPIRFPKNRGVQYGFVLSNLNGGKGEGFIDAAKAKVVNSPQGQQLARLAYARARLLSGF